MTAKPERLFDEVTLMIFLDTFDDVANGKPEDLDPVRERLKDFIESSMRRYAAERVREFAERIKNLGIYSPVITDFINAELAKLEEPEKGLVKP